MPSLPSYVASAPVPDLDDITLCEVSCRLVGTRDAIKTGCTKGITLPSVQVDLNAVERAFAQYVPVVEVCRPSANGEAGSAQRGQAVKATRAGSSSESSSTAVQVLKAVAQFILARLGLQGFLQPPGGPSAPTCLAWHCNQQTLAIAHASSGAVLLYNVADAAVATAVGTAECLHQAQQVLIHQLQQQVSSLAWRPVHCSMLAVGCGGGVALWSLGKLPLAASNIHRGWDGGAADAGAGQGGGWVTFLPFKHGCRVSALCWSPDGRLLAGSSTDTNRVMVWDVALGVGSSLRLGLEPVTCLSWSPDGSYLFAAARSGRFFMYETSTWTLRSWDTPSGSAVTAAAWAPDSGVVLLALSGSSYLIALHLVGQPPNLTEQLLPIMLPGVSDLLQDGPAGASIQSLAWDPSGNRLAVVLSKPHPAAGTVALYSTTFTPVVSCNLIGFVQPGSVAAAAAVAASSEKGPSSSVAEVDGQGSDSSSDAQLQVAFAPVPGKAGALLSVGQCSDGDGTLGAVRNIPMYF